MRTIRAGINLISVIALLVALGTAVPLRAQEDPDTFIAKLVEQMSPQAKVGQLFVVTFPGAQARPGSDIAKLITEYQVGGVVLSTDAGNIANTGSTVTQLASLTAALQGLARPSNRPADDNGKSAPFIPLFIAVNDTNDLLPYSQAIDDLTPLPNSLALGATWKREDAYMVGQAAGQELAALGINLLLGPSFDLLADPSQVGAEGEQVFGGDLYWVGVLGQEFVRGLREGSLNHVAAVLSHFPGQGVTASQPATIDKSLAELEKQDMAPFLRVMAVPAGATYPTAGALMVTQMRYRGFAGNIRERTRPLAVDAQAMRLLLELPQAKAWRDAGGVLFSDSLGSAALRAYYDPDHLTLPTRRAAQEAFLAGNDVLMLSNVGEGTWQTQLDAIVDTITFFQNKYSTDLTFQARVNDAVARILRLKYRLYPDFDASAVPVDPQAARGLVGLKEAVTEQVAQDAVTRLWPAPGQPAAPAIAPEDNLLILTDNRQVRDCSTCAPRPVIRSDALARAIVQHYGASGRIDPARIASLDFNAVRAYLAGTQAEDAPDVGAAFGAANWVVLAIVDAQAEPAASLLQQLLLERPDLLNNIQEGQPPKQVVALSFGVPYALDKSQVSSLAAYYGLYGSSAPFVDVAAQLLFGDLITPGASPVSVPAIGYDLVKQLEPNPDQFIQIFIGEAPAADATPQPLSIKVGDTIKLRTGIIQDRNGQPVPDDTPLTFTRLYSEGLELPALVVGTRNGVALAEFALDRMGPWRIRAFSEPALTSYELQLTVLEGQPAQISTIVPPTITPTPIPPTITPTPTSTPSPTPTLTPTPTPTPWWNPLAQEDAPRRVDWYDLLIALAGIASVSSFAHHLVMSSARRESKQVIAMRWALGCGGAGLIGYTLYGLGLPGINNLDSLGSAWGALVLSVAFAALPLLANLGRNR
jgi:beta-N-acetylhexosaminidase